MPFYIYRLEANEYICSGSATLAGRNGPFRHAASASSPEWELSESNLLVWHKSAPEQHAIIIDLKPTGSTLNLYRLKHVWGYTSHNCTPMAWELEALYRGDPLPSGVSLKDLKQQFPRRDVPGDRVYQFLYLKEDWTLGRVGNVNPLLWDSLLDSLLKRINRKRRDTDRLPPLGWDGDVRPQPAPVAELPIQRAETLPPPKPAALRFALVALAAAVFAVTS